MSRRPALRPADLKATLTALREAGIAPTALDTRPDGSFRWHFTPVTDGDENALDRELEELARKHGYG